MSDRSSRSRLPTTSSPSLSSNSSSNNSRSRDCTANMTLSTDEGDDGSYYRDETGEVGISRTTTAIQIDTSVLNSLSNSTAAPTAATMNNHSRASVRSSSGGGGGGARSAGASSAVAKKDIERGSPPGPATTTTTTGQREFEDDQGSLPPSDDEQSIYSSDGDSLSNQTSSNWSSMTDDKKKNKTSKDDDDDVSIAKRENQAVMIWKLVVLSVLVLITVGVSITVFVYVDSKEQQAFEANYEEDVEKIFTDVGVSIGHRFAQLDAIALGTASYANATSARWPGVTIPDSAVKFAKARSATGAVSLAQYQFVANELSEEVAQRMLWENYARLNGPLWLEDALKTQQRDETYQGLSVDDTLFKDYLDRSIDRANEGINYAREVVPFGTGPYTPSWQSYPVAPNKIDGGGVYNWNAINNTFLQPSISQVLAAKKAVLSPILNMKNEDETSSSSAVTDQDIADMNEWASQLIPAEMDASEPIMKFLYPILNTAAGYNFVQTQDFESSQAVAFLSGTYYWSTLLSDILPSGQEGLVVVVSNNCGQTFTYEINGANTTYMGAGDMHDKTFDIYETSTNLTDLSYHFDGEDFVYTGLPLDDSDNVCDYMLTVYPSKTLEEKYRSNDPIIFMYSVVIIFAFTVCCFMGYDKLVAVRQRKVLATAQKSNAIISSLFPSNVRDRLMANGDGGEDTMVAFTPTKTRLKNYLQDGDAGKGGGKNVGNKPIADLFTDCTVMFADISGFTAWSSVREPGQVFLLLETLYGAFDQIALRRGVFKVETIGDSYVAVAGLPEPRPDHAIVMAKFARDCRSSCADICSNLEVTLGPDTGDLRMRFGLHSGPVTAGVLRGQKSRFQLFGDTVNTAARMESTGVIGRIQVSQTTADQLIEANKSHWLAAREELVEAKGKGSMQTYFVDPNNHRGERSEEMRAMQDELEEEALIDSKTERLVNWNVVVLSRMLAHIVTHRTARNKGSKRRGDAVRSKMYPVEWTMPENAFVLDEVKEVIELPEFAATELQDSDGAVLSDEVQNQLKDYVTCIAKLYHENPFHSFEHASHVCMSVAKLLSRIVAPDAIDTDVDRDGRILASAMHDHTYGITSDPLTQFSCVFAALIHDADHDGVANATLIEEGADIATIYKGKSVAEQNSVNLAWNMLLSDRYRQLRDTICATQSEEVRFRQLVVNTVMATDIMDKDLKKLRDARWKRAFDAGKVLDGLDEPEHPTSQIGGSSFDEDRIALNRKATIVIEHLIQASDVAHTMQHWHIYRKWNERLFMEMHKAYKAGRTDKDPSEFWYKGEIGFFDFYIIPLAKKLSDCGVFGVSSDEYLNYAIQNRNEWEKKGEYVVQTMVEKVSPGSDS
mmetsp:Transcript_27427/g.65843  ORF Transcript_27427/g.65843 Transcript_27427/m.65843 type:complete len:1348 (+) Transcript_27427:241-4284(+)